MKTIDAYAYKIKNFTQLRHYPNASNCKVCTFDSVGSCLMKDKKKTISMIRAKASMYFFVHVTDYEDIKILQKEFSMVYCNHVPIGYSGGFQYHALFARDKDHKYKGRIEEEGVVTEPSTLPKSLINKILSYKSKTWLKKFLEKL
jgi:hypothetical protein